MDGGASSPAMTTPSMFQPRPSGTTETCKETIFLPGNGISLHKNRCGRAVHAAATDFIVGEAKIRKYQEKSSKAFALPCTEKKNMIS